MVIEKAWRIESSPAPRYSEKGTQIPLGVNEAARSVSPARRSEIHETAPKPDALKNGGGFQAAERCHRVETLPLFAQVYASINAEQRVGIRTVPLRRQLHVGNRTVEPQMTTLPI